MPFSRTRSARTRIRGVGQFTAPSTRSGKAFVHDGRSVRIKEGNFELTWNGPHVIAEILGKVESAINNLSTEALQYMRSVVPVDTGALRDSCFVTVQISNIGRLQLIIGADTPYAIYVELGTYKMSAQPYMRPTFDYVVSRLPALLRSEVARRGS